MVTKDLTNESIEGEPRSPRRPVTLKTISDQVGLSVGTISAVLNDSPAARHIPQETRDRILASARALEYRPNFFARTLRNKRTFTVGVIAHEIGDAYSSLVIAGIEKLVRERNYSFLTGIHRHKPELFEQYCNEFLQRGAEGIITVDYNFDHGMTIPTVAVGGHPRHEGVTNIILDHTSAAALALQHFTRLGHRKIAFMKGHPASSDAVTRWQAICDVAHKMGLEIDPSLAIQIESEESSPHVGYAYANKLLEGGLRFTALFAFNDIMALGAMRAFQAAGYGVPGDVSVMGFDDIALGEFHYPSLTTVRQPLQQMGAIAVQILLERIEGGKAASQEIAIQPELVERESTARVSGERLALQQTSFPARSAS